MRLQASRVLTLSFPVIGSRRPYGMVRGARPSRILFDGRRCPVGAARGQVLSLQRAFGSSAVRYLGGCRVAGALAALAAALCANAQEAPAFMERLSAAQIDVAPPASRVRGLPGAFALQQTGCRAGPVENPRRRIVDIAVQEWAYFGFAVMDETDPASWARPRGRRGGGAAFGSGRGVAFDDPERRAALERQVAEAARVAPSIAGYWAVTGDGAWIVERYNDDWRRSG